MATLAKKSPTKDPTIFIWEGKNKAGVKVRGENEAANVNMLRATLRRRGIQPKIIKVKRKPMFGASIGPSDIAYFARQLTAMMRSGVPLVQSLELISNGHEKAGMQDLIKKIRQDIEGGADLGTALGNHPKHFDDLFVSLVKAGEHSGSLEDMLEKIATYKEKSESMKAKVKKAMMYPLMVLIMAAVVSCIMLIWVIPQFKSIFDSFGADLPAFTLWVIGLSEWLQASWWQPLLGMIIIGVAFKQSKMRSEKFNVFVDAAALKIPVMGVIIEKSAIARFARTLATMFAAGVPMVESMDSVAGSTGNRLFANATLQIKDDISKGVQLNTAMMTTQRFPSMVVQMTKIGEESGRLEEMLNKVAEYFEEQVDDLVDTLSKQIEPLVMAVLGVIIGGLVIAMYLPIFKLGAAVG